MLITLLSIRGDELQTSAAAGQARPLTLREPVAAPASPEPSDARPSSPIRRFGVTSPFRIYIDDPKLAKAAIDALTGASEWLDRQTCQFVFAEFLDERGAPLSDKLQRLETTPRHYLRMVLFVDGERHRSCAREGVLAFTSPHSRVVYLCGREFQRVSRKSVQDAQVAVIHELLHTLGLGENPPTSRQITLQVRQRCWQ